MSFSSNTSRVSIGQAKILHREDAGAFSLADEVMSKLTLRFSTNSTPELQAVCFRHVLLGVEERRSMRGKNGGAFNERFTFQWTSAVQATALLILKAKLNLLNGETEEAFIEGAQGSFAASLDYALTKQPRWLEEIFGRDRRDNLIALRLFRRSNSERKNGGLVRIALNQQMLPYDRIQILGRDRELVQALEFDQLILAIQRNWEIHGNVKTTASDSLLGLKAQTPAAAALEQERKIIAAELCRDTVSMLKHTDIFDPKFITASLRGLYQSPSFMKVLGRDKDKLFRILSEVNHSLLVSERLGIEDNIFAERILDRKEPLYFAAPASAPATWPLLMYLKDVRAYNLVLEYRFPHAIDIVRRFLKGQFTRLPDICILGIGPTGTLLARDQGKTYRPLMLMPALSHRMLAPEEALNNKKENSAAQISYLKDDPSTSSFYYDSLVSSGAVPGRKFKTFHMEPDEAAKVLATGDPERRAILFFPHYALNQAYNRTVTLDQENNPARLQESVLFVHQRIYEDQKLCQAIEIAIRNAWLTLSADHALLEELVQRLSSNDEFIRFLLRISGTQYMRNAGNG
ncbi:hypothetical protein JNK13_06985 [bacterium]|nr:hypothetical protein [bacterium]